MTSAYNENGDIIDGEDLNRALMIHYRALYNIKSFEP